MKNILFINSFTDGANAVFIDDLNKLNNKDIEDAIIYCIQNPHHDRFKKFGVFHVLNGDIFDNGYNILNILQNIFGCTKDKVPFSVENVIYCYSTLK